MGELINLMDALRRTMQQGTHPFDSLGPEYEGLHLLRRLQTSERVMERTLGDTIEKAAREAFWSVLYLNEVMLTYKPIIERLEKLK